MIVLCPSQTNFNFTDSKFCITFTRDAECQLCSLALYWPALPEGNGHAARPVQQVAGAVTWPLSLDSTSGAFCAGTYLYTCLEQRIGFQYPVLSGQTAVGHSNAANRFTLHLTQPSISHSLFTFSSVYEHSNEYSISIKIGKYFLSCWVICLSRNTTLCYFVL
jgi:hypothetical protein